MINTCVATISDKLVPLLAFAAMLVVWQIVAYCGVVAHVYADVV